MDALEDVGDAVKGMSYAGNGRSEAASSMRQYRFLGIVYLIVGLAFAQNVIRNAITSRGLGYHGCWPEFITASLGIVFGVTLIVKSAKERT